MDPYGKEDFIRVDVADARDAGLIQQTGLDGPPAPVSYTQLDVYKRQDFLRSHRRVSTLSGGEKVKIQLARILMEEPDVLLLDEPTNDLDIETLEWMENYIRRSRAPVLFVSHDETLIENTANVIIHMEQLVRKTRCRISVTHAGYREYLAARRQSFDKQEQVARKQRADYGRQMERWRQVYDRVDHEQRVISRQDPGGGRLLKKKMKAVLSQEKRFERQAESFLDFPEEEAAILTRFSEDIRLPKGCLLYTSARSSPLKRAWIPTWPMRAA